MITVFESHLPPEFLEAAAAQYNALATLGQAVDVPAAQQAAEPLRKTAERASGINISPGPRGAWQGKILPAPTVGRNELGLFVFLTRHNKGAGTLVLAPDEAMQIDARIVPSVGLAVLMAHPCVWSFQPPAHEQVVLWCGL